MYRYLVRAFAAGPGIVQMYQDPAVMRVFEICRNVGNETHLLLQFIRFRQLPGNVLFAETEPKNYQLTLTAPHFADRLPDENWIIYEKNHGPVSYTHLDVYKRQGLQHGKADSADSPGYLQKRSYYSADHHPQLGPCAHGG